MQIDKELIKQALMLGKRRGCCERILCLICCCDASDIGSHSHLSQLNDADIQMYQLQLQRRAEIIEMTRKNTL